MMMSDIEDEVRVQKRNDSKSLKKMLNEEPSSLSTPYTAKRAIHNMQVNQWTDNFASSQVAALNELVFDAPDMDLAKVERIKKMIHTGTYQTSSTKIAACLLSTV